MPLTEKGQKILRKMEQERGSEKAGKREFYASRNAGTISGVDNAGINLGSRNPTIKGRDLFKVGGQSQNINTNNFVPGGRRR